VKNVPGVLKAEMKILTENLPTTAIQLILYGSYCIATGWLSVRYIANYNFLLSLCSFSGGCNTGSKGILKLQKGVMQTISGVGK
jgi:hypothetical protein